MVLELAFQHCQQNGRHQKWSAVLSLDDSLNVESVVESIMLVLFVENVL